MTQTFLSFAAFIYGESQSVKKCLIMSEKVILPIPKESLYRFVNDISGKSRVAQKQYLNCLTSLDSVIGKEMCRTWLKSFTNWFDPNQNVAIGTVPGCETVRGIAEKMAPFTKQFYPIYSAIYSSYLYEKHSIPNLSLEGEMDAIESQVNMREYERANVKLFETISTLALPDLNSVSWEELASIRNNKYFKKFIQKLSELRVEEIKTEGSSYHLILGDLFQFVSKLKPSLVSSTIKGIICNLPIGAVNPFAIGDTLNELSKIREIEQRYGYLFFIESVRRNM